MPTTLNTRLLIKRDTAANWATSTLTFKAGEMAYDLTNHILYVSSADNSTFSQLFPVNSASDQVSSGIYNVSSSLNTTTGSIASSSINIPTGDHLKVGDILVGPKYNTSTSTAIADSLVIAKVTEILENVGFTVLWDSTTISGGGGGIPELTSQYIRIYDLDYGIYRWNYNGQKYLYYMGQSGTTAGAVGTSNSDNFIIYVYKGFNIIYGGACKSYLIFGTLSTNMLSTVPALYYGDSSVAASSTVGTFISGLLNPVAANDTSATTGTLTSLKVGSINYAVGSGSTAGVYTSSGINTSGSAAISTVSVLSGQTLKMGDLVVGPKLGASSTAITGSLVIAKVAMIMGTTYMYSVIYDSTTYINTLIGDALAPYMKRVDAFVDDKIVAVLQTPSANQTITFDFNCATVKTGKSFIVDWGDGAITTVASNATTASHTYTTAGNYVCYIYNVSDFNSYYSSYGDGVFYGARSSLTKVVLPEGITRIPGYCFNGCTNIKEVTLPHSLAQLDMASGNGLSNYIVYYNGSKAEWSTRVLRDMDDNWSPINQYYLNDGSSNFDMPICYGMYDSETNSLVVTPGSPVPASGNVRLIIVPVDGYDNVLDYPMYFTPDGRTTMPIVDPFKLTQTMLSLAGGGMPTPVTLRYLENQYYIHYGNANEFITIDCCIVNNFAGTGMSGVLLNDSSERNHIIVSSIEDDGAGNYCLHNLGANTIAFGMGAGVNYGQEYTFLNINQTGLPLDQTLLLTELLQGNDGFPIGDLSLQPTSLRAISTAFASFPHPDDPYAVIELYGFTGTIIPPVPDLGFNYPSILPTGGGKKLYSHEVWIAFSDFTLVLSYIDRSSTPIDYNTVGNIYEPVLTGAHGSYRVEQGYGYQGLVNIGLMYDPTLFEITTVFWDTANTNNITIVDWTSSGNVIDDYVYEITGGIADDYIAS